MTSLTQEIKDGVEKNGFHEEWAVALINMDFREEYGGKKSQEQIDEWCAKVGLRYEIFQKKDAHGTPRQVLRFTKAPSREKPKA